MFTNGSLDALAKKAKDQLAEQLAEDTEISNEDLYAEFREDDKSDNSGDISGNGETQEEQQYTIKNQPDSYVSNPTLKAQPDEEYLENENPTLSPYDEPIFAGGPTVTQVEMWKRQWDGYDIIAIEILGQFFVFRTLNRFEYKQLAAIPNLNPLQREEIICETCTLWPSGYNFKDMAVAKAGIPSTYSQIIMENSGFTKDYSIQIL